MKKKFQRWPRPLRITGISSGILLLFFAVLLCGCTRFFETGLLKSQLSRHATPQPFTRIDVGDGKTIAAVYLPAPNPDAYTVLYSYGNLEDLNGKYDLLREFHRRGYGVLGYDYEGFGSSEGTPSPTAALRDAEVAYRYLTERCGVAPECIITAGIEDEMRFEIHGSKGALRFNGMNPYHLAFYDVAAAGFPTGGVRGWTAIDTGQRYDQPAGFPGPKFAIGWLRGHMQCLYHFLDAVHYGNPGNPGLEQGIYVQKLIEKTRESAQTNQWIKYERQMIGRLGGSRYAPGRVAKTGISHSNLS